MRRSPLFFYPMLKPLVDKAVEIQMQSEPTYEAGYGLNFEEMMNIMEQLYAEQMRLI